MSLRIDLAEPGAISVWQCVLNIGMEISRSIGMDTQMGLEIRRLGLVKDKGNQGACSGKDRA